MDDWFATLDRLTRALPSERYRVAAIAPATRQAAAPGLPVLLASSPAAWPRDDVTALLLRHAHRLRPDRPVLDQVIATMRADRTWRG